MTEALPYCTQCARVSCQVCGSVLNSRGSRASHEFHVHGIKGTREQLLAHRTYHGRMKRRAQSPAKRHHEAFVGNANARARRYGLPGRLSLRDVLPEGPCTYCGGETNSWDHVVPLGKGGANHVSNLVPCCESCNRRKNVGGPEAATELKVIEMACAWCGKLTVRTATDLRRSLHRGGRFVACHQCISKVQSHGVRDPRGLIAA